MAGTKEELSAMSIALKFWSRQVVHDEYHNTRQPTYEWCICESKMSSFLSS